MAGANNQYVHPHEEVLIKLNDAQVDTYVTFLHGNIIIATDGQTYDMNVKQPYQYVLPKNRFRTELLVVDSFGEFLMKA